MSSQQRKEVIALAGGKGRVVAAASCCGDCTLMASVRLETIVIVSSYLVFGHGPQRERLVVYALALVSLPESQPIREWHAPRHLAGLPGHQQRLGRGDARYDVVRPRVRRARCDSLAVTSGGRNPKWPNRWRRCNVRKGKTLGDGSLELGIDLLVHLASLRHVVSWNPTPEATAMVTYAASQGAGIRRRITILLDCGHIWVAPRL